MFNNIKFLFDVFAKLLQQLKQTDPNTKIMPLAKKITCIHYNYNTFLKQKVNFKSYTKVDQ